MASKADLIVVENTALFPLPVVVNLSARECVRTKGFFTGCKNMIPLLRMPKSQRHLLAFDLLVHFYLQPDRCKRFFLQPSASHPDVQVLKAPSK